MKKINCILLIDDNPADNEFHKIVITEADVCNHVKIAMSGREALSYIAKSSEQNGSDAFPKADLIFLDINMPGMNGFEFLLAYEKLDEKLKSKVVIVMLTTSLNPDDNLKAVKSGAITKYLNKPLTVDIVRFMVDKYFGNN